MIAQEFDFPGMPELNSRVIADGGALVELNLKEQARARGELR